VFTYVNPTAARAALSGAFPFPVGAVLAKESFENDGGKAGPKGPLFVMEKRARGYDPERNDWHYAMLNPDGVVAMAGDGSAGELDRVLLRLPQRGAGQRLRLWQWHDHEGEAHPDGGAGDESLCPGESLCGESVRVQAISMARRSLGLRSAPAATRRSHRPDPSRADAGRLFPMIPFPFEGGVKT